MRHVCILVFTFRRLLFGRATSVFFDESLAADARVNRCRGKLSEKKKVKRNCQRRIHGPISRNSGPSRGPHRSVPVRGVRALGPEAAAELGPFFFRRVWQGGRNRRRNRRRSRYRSRRSRRSRRGRCRRRSINISSRQERC